MKLSEAKVDDRLILGDNTDVIWIVNAKLRNGYIRLKMEGSGSTTGFHPDETERIKVTKVPKEFELTSDSLVIYNYEGEQVHSFTLQEAIRLQLFLNNNLEKYVKDSKRAEIDKQIAKLEKQLKALYTTRIALDRGEST
jgi:hypothetical protein